MAEAIGAGCPVVITPECGAPIKDGREGLLVESRNVEAMTLAVKRMVADRAFRDSCSTTCLEQAAFYSLEEWQKRLVPEIISLVS